jgi:hypothetical protein
LYRVEDRGDSLVSTKETTDLLKVNGFENRGDLASWCWGYASHTASMSLDPATGKPIAEYVGPDGLRYSRVKPYGKTYQWIVRRNAAGDYSPFEKGTQAEGGEFTPFKAGPVTHNGKPVLGIYMNCAGGGGTAHSFQDPLCVAPNGDIYAPTYVSPVDVPEMGKVGVAPPKNYSHYIDNLCVFAPDGTRKCVSALPGLMISHGIRIGRSGALYVATPLHPLGQALPDGLAAGSQADGDGWGTLTKFKSGFDKFPVGRMVGMWEDQDADNPTHSLGKGRRKVRVENAHWSYGGVGPMIGSPQSCTCIKCTFDLDGYERAFVPMFNTATVNVLDSNGNVIARFGGYGNIDCQGENSPVPDPKTGLLRPRRPDDPKDLKSPLAEKKLAFCMPYDVAAGDGVMYVRDPGNRTMVRARLVYAAEEAVPVP